jgi:hypothetical protein
MTITCYDILFIVRDRNTREGKRRPVSGMSVNYPVRPYSAMTGYEDDDLYDEDQWVSVNLVNWLWNKVAVLST